VRAAEEQQRKESLWWEQRYFHHMLEAEAVDCLHALSIRRR
jgi:hypothetical protein